MAENRDMDNRELPYDDGLVNASVESLRRWRDDPDKYPFVVGAVLPVLHGYEAYQDAWDQRHTDAAIWGSIGGATDKDVREAMGRLMSWIKNAHIASKPGFVDAERARIANDVTKAEAHLLSLLLARDGVRRA